MQLTEKQVLERLDRRKEIVTARISEFRRWLRHEKLFIQLMESEHRLPGGATIPLIEYEKALARVERAVDDAWTDYVRIAGDETDEIRQILEAQPV